MRVPPVKSKTDLADAVKSAIKSERIFGTPHKTNLPTLEEKRAMIKLNKKYHDLIKAPIGWRRIKSSDIGVHNDQPRILEFSIVHNLLESAGAASSRLDHIAVDREVCAVSYSPAGKTTQDYEGEEIELDKYYFHFKVARSSTDECRDVSKA